MRLAAYLNAVHPVERVFDGFLLSVWEARAPRPEEHGDAGEQQERQQDGVQGKDHAAHGDAAREAPDQPDDGRAEQERAADRVGQDPLQLVVEHGSVVRPQVHAARDCQDLVTGPACDELAQEPHQLLLRSSGDP